MHQAHAERLERLVQQQQERDAERKQAQERRERKQRERDEKRKQAQRVGTPVVASLEPDLEAMSVVVAAHLIGLVAPGGPWAGYYVYPCQGYEHTMTLPGKAPPGVREGAFTPCRPGRGPQAPVLCPLALSSGGVPVGKAV